MEQAVMRADAPPPKDNSTFFASRSGTGYATLFYDPPYGSELDDALARHLIAYLVPSASLEYKAFVWATHSRSRFDFLIDLGTRRIAIDYTDTPANVETALVEDNDALVLGAGVADTILRVRRRDLEERMYDCLHVIATWEPDLFTPYGKRMFAARCSEEARETPADCESDLVRIHFAAPEEMEPPIVVNDAGTEDEIEWPPTTVDGEYAVIRRLSREQPDIWRRQYERATLVYGRDPVRRMHRV